MDTETVVGIHLAGGVAGPPALVWPQAGRAHLETAVLDRSVVLVEYLMSSGTTLIFGVRGDSSRPEVVAVPIDRAELMTFCQANFGVGNKVRDLVDMGLEEIWHGYDALIAPIAEWARPGDIVHLVPHGALHQLPLHALTLGNGQYLIERNPVSYSPSSAALRYIQANRRSSMDVAGRGTTAIFGDSRQNLPAARLEAESLAALLGTRAFVGNAVTRDAFVRAAANADIIHFAGHAEFSPLHALESGLQLAGDDVLTAGEVFGLEEIHTDLVTLSGCETGINERSEGDELFGLTRAFLYARASSVLVSLWEVGDDSTAFLMHQFYRYLLAERPMLKVDALRQAMLDVRARRGWEAFYHWAPFVLIGDWR